MGAFGAGFMLIGWICSGAPVPQQVEVDKTLERVFGTAIMASDVRQARLLNLLADAGPDDRSIQTALENRLLMLREVSRVLSVEPSAAAIAARRQAWAASWPPGTDLPALMARAGMSDQALDGWFRDDVRIATYVDQRFGQRANADREKRIAEWIDVLRRRANLTGKRP